MICKPAERGEDRRVLSCTRALAGARRRRRIPENHVHGYRVRNNHTLFFSVIILGLAFCCAASAQNGELEAKPFAFEVSELNEGLPHIDAPLRLDTPRATMEFFLDAVGSKEFMQAARALNLSGLTNDEQASRAPDIALKLAFLLRRHDLIDWTELPDEPDARVLPGPQQSFSPYSRRSVELGEVGLDGRPVPISLQRIHVKGSDPAWLFSPFAVERVSDMYAQDRSRLFHGWVPLQDRLDTIGKPSAYEWMAVALLLLVSAVLCFLVYRLMRAISFRLSLRWRHAAQKIRSPLAILVGALSFRLGTDHLFLLTGPIASNLEIASIFIALFSAAWLLFRIVSLAMLFLSNHYIVPLASDDPVNRRTKTTVFVVRRLTMALVAMLSIGYVLFEIGVFDNFGLSILASAGALGVIGAIAARPLLGNMVSGLQIALTDPVRIGDVVVFDGHWSTVEDIAFAHTVLRTWTDTRLIVPHSDLLSRPFENWSKEGEAVKRIVKIPVDYCIDVENIRAKAREIIEDDPRATGPPLVEMVEINGETAVVWIWVSGTTAITSWYLHNDVREHLMTFLKELDNGAFLPRKRHILLE